MELDDVKDAMIDCHVAAKKLEHAKRRAAEKAAREQSPAAPVLSDDLVEPSVDSSSPAMQPSPEAGSPAPDPDADVPASNESEDADWDLQRAAFAAGKLKIPGSKVPGK